MAVDDLFRSIRLKPALLESSPLTPVNNLLIRATISISINSIHINTMVVSRSIGVVVLRWQHGASRVLHQILFAQSRGSLWWGWLPVFKRNDRLLLVIILDYVTVILLLPTIIVLVVWQCVTTIVSNIWTFLRADLPLQDYLSDFINKARSTIVFITFLGRWLLFTWALLAFICKISPELRGVLLLLHRWWTTVTWGTLSLLPEVAFGVLVASVGIWARVRLDGFLGLLEDCVLAHVLSIVCHIRWCLASRVVLQYLLVINDIARRLISRQLVVTCPFVVSSFSDTRLHTIF